MEINLVGDDTSNPVRVAMRFNEALNARDIDSMMSMMTQDCVFEDTNPAPDGTRYSGQAQVRAYWEQFFVNSRYAVIDIEYIFGIGARCVMLWRYRWVSAAGEEGHIRGVDVYTILDGLIAEKLSYVKG
ncbi:MAG: nuclear transport factor 2 family protein [Anaerolineales bacterium]